jgi:hypothetical protein
MLRVAAGAGLLVVAGCGDDSSGATDGAGGDLAERVVAVLEADGQTVDGDLEGADVSCPDVHDPQPGDRATCDVRFGPQREVEVDVEFGDGGSITVVAVVPR